MEKGKLKESDVHQGYNVQFFRNGRRMNQDVFAVKMNMSRSSIVRLENSPKIDHEILAKCGEVLDVPVNLLEDLTLDDMIRNITYNIEKIDNNGNCSNVGGNNNENVINPIETVVELSNKNAELYERMLQMERERVAELKQQLSEKK